MKTGYIMDYINTLIPVIPGIVINVLAIIVILALWNRAPRAAVWALLGFGLLLVVSLAVPLLYPMIGRMMQSHDAEAIRSRYQMISFTGSFLRGVAFLLILAAVYAGRPPAQGSR
jgi:hypothetical protein